MKKRFIPTLVALVFVCSLITSVCTANLNVFADDSKNITTIFENEATQQDKEYISKRDNLIEKHGIDKAYELLGYKLVKKEMNTTDPTIIPSEEDPSSCISYETLLVNKGIIEVRVYKNISSGTLDFVYTMDYINSRAGILAYDDVMCANFDGADVYKTSTSYPSTINSYKPATYGGGGFITDHSTSAFIIFTTKPRNGFTLDTAHGNAWMDFGEKNKDLPEGVSISVGYGIASISYTSTTFTDYYVECYW